MGWWTEHVVPRLVDLSLSSPPVEELRARVCRGLEGRVLELGFGSGLNLPHLPAAVDTLDAVDPSEVAWRRSAARRDASAVPVQRVGLDGETLEADDQAYDAVLMTFVLCTVPDPARVLAEAVRVLRPGGRLHFVEHGLSPDPGVVRWQHRLEPFQRRIAGGCRLTRDAPALVRDAGLEVTTLGQRYLDGTPRAMRPWAYVSLGTGGELA